MSLIHHLIIFIRYYINKLIAIPFPTLFSGEHSLNHIEKILAEDNIQRVFIVTDPTLIRLGIIQPLLDKLNDAKVAFDIFDALTPDPTVAQVSSGVEEYTAQNYEAIIAFGGGSVIDCAKAIAASAIKNKSIKSLAGLFKVRQTLPLFIAIPTTAGTGSEATLVAVVTDSKNKQKFTVIDPSLVPRFAILDPSLMTGLPKNITAETGIDALTHAIESYISLHATPETKQYSIEAIESILTFLPLAYSEGANLNARSKMSVASYSAGIAFTRASIGYVHAIAHQLGGIYHIPHGLANAVLLKHVLKFSFDSVKHHYADIAYKLALASRDDSLDDAANHFITAIEKLLETLNIPNGFTELKTEDIAEIAQRAIKEAFCEYPVPKIMSVVECKKILCKIQA